jgi:hypothetical protein
MPRKKKLHELTLIAACVVASFISTACKNAPQLTDEELAQAIAQGIVASCPLASPNDQGERDRCAERLTRLDVLRTSMADPIFWGGQKAGAGYDYKKSNTTDFNPLVWRRMYLSTFMFNGESRIEKAGALTVLHLPDAFRNALDSGAYPYPFWHSKAKWDSYQHSTELLIFIQGGRVVGSLRSSNTDPSRPTVTHEWDGLWKWTDSRGAEPYVSLYSYLLSPSNPHTARLETAYRAFEDGMRTESCEACHSPDNKMMMNPLELFSYPNQALTARHKIVAQLENNTMPPQMGISDEGTRQDLIRLAKDFAAAGDDALAFEDSMGEAR